MVEFPRGCCGRWSATDIGPLDLSFGDCDLGYAKDLRWSAATLWAGPKCHIVHYPLSDRKAFNLVVTYHNDAPEPVAGLPVSHEEVRKGFEHVNPVARRSSTREGIGNCGCYVTAIR
jgi:hypothetical protein